MLGRKECILYVSLFLLLTVIALSLLGAPALGYEISIYSAIPIHVWVLSFLFIFFCVILFLSKVVSGNYQQRYYWVLVIIALVLFYLLLFSLPLIKGYCMYGQFDPATHFGRVNSILTQGEIPSQIIYPAFYIVSAAVTSITGLNTASIFLGLPVIFEILFFLFMYTLVRLIVPKEEYALVTVLIFMAPVHGWFVQATPNQFANLCYPLAMYVVMMFFLKRNGKAISLVLLILVILSPLFHLISTIALGILIVTLLTERPRTKANNEGMFLPRCSLLSRQSLRFMCLPLALLIIWTVMWISLFYVWDHFFSGLISLIVNDSESKAATLMQTIGDASKYGYNVPEVILRLYLGQILLGICGAIVWIKVLFGHLSYKVAIPNIKQIAIYQAILIVLVFAFYALNLPFGPLRLLFYILIINTIFTGILLTEVLKLANFRKTLQKWILTACVIIFICTITFHGIMTVYQSPLTYTANGQVSKANINAASWFLDNRDQHIEPLGISFPLGRYSDLLAPDSMDNVGLLPETLTVVKYHFGRDLMKQLGQCYLQDKYLLINKQDKLFYEEVFPEMAKSRYIKEDFNVLQNDDSVGLIYNSYEFESYYICAQEEDP